MFFKKSFLFFIFLTFFSPLSWSSDPISTDPSGIQPEKSIELGTSAGDMMEVIVSGGHLTQNTTWLKDQIYIVKGDVTVDAGVTLTIEEGVIVKFEGAATPQPDVFETPELIVNGILKAEGAENNWITFTTGHPNQPWGSWEGISFNGAESSASHLSYFTLEYSLQGIKTEFSSPAIDHAIISKNYIGVYAFIESFPTLDQVTITQNKDYGVLIQGDLEHLINPAPVITNSAIIFNDGDGVRISNWRGRQSEAIELMVNDSSIYGNKSQDVIIDNASFGLRFNFQNNWWGQTNLVAIEEKITHGLDIPGSGFAYIEFNNIATSLDEVTKPYGGTYLIESITEDTIWTKANGPYHLAGTIVVNENATLTIEPGTEIRIVDLSGLEIRGTLNAQGTANEKIKFQLEYGFFGDAATFISFISPDASDSILKHAEYLTSTSGFLIDNSSPTFDHVEVKAVTPVENSIFGIVVTGNSAAPQLSHLKLTGLGVGVYAMDNTGLVITDSTLSNNGTGFMYEVGFQSNPPVQPHPVVHRTIFTNQKNVEIIASPGHFVNPNDSWNFENNWWGTTNVNNIKTSITDHEDYNHLPFIDFVPFLSAPPQPAELVGDGNNDGVVNQTDYQIWRANFGTSTNQGQAKGDYNKNGIVDASDYVIWRNNLGATAASSAFVEERATDLSAKNRGGSPFGGNWQIMSQDQALFSPTENPLSTPSKRKRPAKK